MWRANLVYLIVLSISSSFVIGQSRMQVNYTMEDGLPSNFVYRAVQDTAGYIWFCTDKGVAKFDGTSFRTFKMSDGLPHNDIFDIGLDRSGKLWLSTFNSICYIQNDSIHCPDLPNVVINSHVINRFGNNGDYHIIEIRGGGYVLFESNGTINKFNTTTQTGRPLVIESESDFTQFSRNIKNNREIIQKYKDNKLVYTESINSTASLFRYGQIRIDNNHYIFDTDTVFVWTGEILDKHDYKTIWGVNPEIYSVKQDKNNIVIQGYETNIVVNKDLQIIDSLNYLLSKKFNSFIQDNENNIWLCTNSGLSYILNDPKSSIQYSIEDKEDSFRKILKGDHNSVFIITKSGKFYKFEEDHGLALFKDLNSEKIKDVAFSKKANKFIFIDLEKGIFLLSADKLKTLSTIPIIPDTVSTFSLKALDVSNEEEIVLSHSGGVMIVNHDNFEAIINKRSYASLYVDNKLFIGTTSGLYTYSDNSISKIADGEFEHYIQNLYGDADGCVWIMPNFEGLWKVDDNSIVELPEVKHLYINNMTTDEDNNMWLATTSGLYKMIVDKNETNYFITRFGNSYGITENNIVDVLYTNDFVYAITEKKMYKLSKNQEGKNKNSKFHFVGTAVNNIKNTPQQLLDLNHKQNNIEVKFSAISHSDLGDFTYYWKLLPANLEWQKSNKSTLLFNSLSPGDYSLLINVEDSQGNLIHKEKELKFSIAKPWYGTNLFYFICSCLLLFTFYMISKRMESAQRKKSDAEYEIQRQFYELRLKAVQAQMNPHFLFNALNSIQKFIYQKSPDEANQYIVKFAKLMRQILESTSKNFSTLHEEIELLSNYIALEQLRFSDSFDFHLNIAKEVFPTELLIPSTILQPFVENSINHGLANKEEHGNLWIRFCVENNKLICEIEDDGIGRNVAMKVKNKDHKSRALEIIKERKEVMLKRDNYDLDFFYDDLVNKLGHIKGTKLTLTIPVNHGL